MEKNGRERISDVFKVELSFATFKNVQNNVSAIRLMEAESLKYRQPGDLQIYAMMYNDKIAFYEKNPAKSLPITTVFYDQIDRVLPEENLFLISFCFRNRNRFFVCCLGFKDITGYYHFMSNLSEYRGWILKSTNSSSLTSKDDYNSSISSISKPTYFRRNIDSHDSRLSIGHNEHTHEEANDRKLITTYVNWNSKSAKQHPKNYDFDSAYSAPSSTSRIEFFRRRNNTKFSDNRFKEKIIYPTAKSCQACQQRIYSINDSSGPKHTCGIPNHSTVKHFSIDELESSFGEETASSITSCDSFSDTTTVYKEITHQRPNSQYINLPNLFECQRFRPNLSEKSAVILDHQKEKQNGSYPRRKVTAASSTSSLEMRVSCDPIGKYILDQSMRIKGKLNALTPSIASRLPRESSMRY